MISSSSSLRRRAHWTQRLAPDDQTRVPYRLIRKHRSRRVQYLALPAPAAEWAGRREQRQSKLQQQQKSLHIALHRSTLHRIALHRIALHRTIIKAVGSVVNEWECFLHENGSIGRTSVEVEIW